MTADDMTTDDMTTDAEDTMERSSENPLPRLFPRPVGVVEASIARLERESTGLRSADAVQSPVAGDLAVRLVLETGEGELEVGDTLLHDRGTTPVDALRSAERNALARPRGATRTVQSGLYIVDDPSFAGLALLRPDVFAGWQFDGEPVILIPDVRTTIVCGSRDVDALAAAAAIADETMAHTTSYVSASPLVAVDGRWQAFVLPPEVDSEWAVNRLTRRWAAMIYERQRLALEKIHSRERRDVRIAPANVVERKGGGLILKTEWSAGSETLLPSADTIVIRTEGRRGDVEVPSALAVDRAPHYRLRRQDSLRSPRSEPTTAIRPSFTFLPMGQSSTSSVRVPPRSVLSKPHGTLLSKTSRSGEKWPASPSRPMALSPTRRTRNREPWP